MLLEIKHNFEAVTTILPKKHTVIIYLFMGAHYDHKNKLQVYH